MIITVISLVYAIVLAPLTDPQGISVYTNVDLHYFVPWVTILGFLLFGSRPRYRVLSCTSTAAKSRLTLTSSTAYSSMVGKYKLTWTSRSTGRNYQRNEPAGLRCIGTPKSTIKQRGRSTSGGLPKPTNTSPPACNPYYRSRPSIGSESDDGLNPEPLLPNGCVTGLLR